MKILIIVFQMVAIIIYSDDKIDFKTFQYDSYKPISYGKMDNKCWYTYGEFSLPEPNKEPGPCMEYIKIKILLGIREAFGKQ